MLDFPAFSQVLHKEQKEQVVETSNDPSNRSVCRDKRGSSRDVSECRDCSVIRGHKESNEYFEAGKDGFTLLCGEQKSFGGHSPQIP
jgi:hypothetical protein